MYHTKNIADLFWLGVKIILKNSENKILLLKMQNRKKEIFWELPGGRVDVGETEHQALMREIYEETGMQKVDNIMHLTMVRSVFRCYTENDINVGLIFSIYTGQVKDEKIILSPEHLDYAWVDQHEADQILDNAYVLRIKQLCAINVNQEKLF